jgi:hypothetical protein
MPWETPVRITYTGPIDEVEIAALYDVTVKRGQTIEVDHDLGASLIEQRGWDADPADVTAFVGEDREWAARLLNAERNGKERPGLIADLEAVADPPMLNGPVDDEPPAPPGVADVPAGTADEVLAWVGDDPRLAGLALTAEHAGKNRSTLLGQLERLATADTTTEGSD